MINNRESYYHSQVELLLKVLPYVAKESCFALKGGTAINFFVRDLPRLSVDIDLTYLPLEPRSVTLTKIEESLNRIVKNITQSFPNMMVREKRSRENGRLNKLFIYQNETMIKIEPNEILRGSVFPIEYRDLSSKVEELFQKSITDMPVLSFADLYAGKICAALSRQHSRDLFDVKLLLENEGLTEEIRTAFVIYLASSSRPIHELLNPNPTLQEMKKSFENDFLGMTTLHVSYEDLQQARLDLIKVILIKLTTNERKFLLSFKMGTPDWSLLPVKNIEKLPGLEWKTINIKKMDAKKHRIATDNLKKVLGL